MKSNQNIYIIIAVVVVALAVAYFFYNKKQKDQKDKDDAATKPQIITAPEKPVYVDNFKAEKYENIYDMTTYPWERCTLSVDEVEGQIKWWLSATENETAEQRLKNLKNKYTNHAKQYPTENLTFKQWFIMDVEWMMQH